MRDAAVFTYVVAVLVAIAVVVYTMVSVSSGQVGWWLPVFVVGLFAFIGLWCLAHWMNRTN